MRSEEDVVVTQALHPAVQRNIKEGDARTSAAAMRSIDGTKALLTEHPSRQSRSPA